MQVLGRQGSRRKRWQILAGLPLVGAIALAAVGVGTAATAAKPAATTPPTISGTANVGSTLTANDGTWSGGGTMTFAYQWLSCDKDGAKCAEIKGAEQKTYVVQKNDEKNTLRIRVTATNAEGSTAATSVQTALVGAATTTTPP